MFLGQVGRYEFGHFHDRLQAQPLRVSERLQPALDEVTGIPGEPGQVSHQAQRRQVKLADDFVRTAKSGVKFFGKFISNARAGQAGERVVYRQKLGVGERGGFRKGFGQIMVVGDKHIHATRAGILHGRVGGDAGITSEDKVCTAVDDFLQERNIYPVALAGAHRNVKGYIRMQLLERLHEDGCGGLTIRIKITPNTDGGMGVDSRFQPIYDGGEPGQVSCRAGGVGLRIQEGPGCLGRAQAAPEQRLCHERVQVRKWGRRIDRRGLNPVHGKLEFDFGNLFEIQIEIRGSRLHFGFGSLQRSGFPAAVTVGPVWTVGALFFIFGEGEGPVLGDLANKPVQRIPVTFVLGGTVGETGWLGWEVGVPVNHLDLPGLDGRAAVQISASLDQQGPVDARLHAGSHPFVLGAFVICFPIENYGFASGQYGDQVIFCQQMMRSGRGGESQLGIFRVAIQFKFISEIIPPPACQVG